MAETRGNPEPRGLGEHARKATSENAHEQGWGLNEDARRRRPAGKQNSDGGADYDYGARDFGDEAVDTAAVRNADPGPEKESGTAEAAGGNQRTSARRG